MNFTLLDMKIKMNYAFFLVIVLFLAFDKLGLSIIVLSSIFLHELGHIIVMRIFGQKIDAVSFDFYGINICKTQTNLSYTKELLISSAGIFINIILALVSFFIVKNEHMYYINLCLIIFNLIPVGRLDGSQILDKILQIMFRHEIAYKIHKFISTLFFIALVLLSFVLIIHDIRYIFLSFTVFYLAYFIISD